MNHIFLKEKFKALLRVKFVMDLLFRTLQTRQGLANVVKMATKSGQESSESYISQRNVQGTSQSKICHGFVVQTPGNKTGPC